METTAIRKEGSQIQKSSLLSTDKPHVLRKPQIPTGETIMGVQGKKYLALSKGDNKAIPNPPFVKASRTP